MTDIDDRLLAFDSRNLLEEVKFAFRVEIGSRFVKDAELGFFRERSAEYDLLN